MLSKVLILRVKQDLHHETEEDVVAFDITDLPILSHDNRTVRDGERMKRHVVNQYPTCSSSSGPSPLQLIGRLYSLSPLKLPISSIES